MARTYSGVPEPRYVERAKFADNGGGGGGGNIVTVPLVLNEEDPSLSYLDITAKELYELFQTEKIVYIKGSYTYSEEHYSEIEVYSTPMIGAYKEVGDTPEAYILYQFTGISSYGRTLFEAHADDEKPVMKE